MDDEKEAIRELGTALVTLIDLLLGSDTLLKYIDQEELEELQLNILTLINM